MRLRGILQNDINDCGAACIATICKYYGYRNSLAFFKESTKSSITGASIYDIIVCAKEIGLEAEALHGKWDDFISEIRDLHFPLIAHINIQDSLYHYIVIEKIIRGKIIAFDPSRGSVKYSHDELKKIWTGYVITFQKGLKFQEKSLIRNEYYKYIYLVTSKWKLLLLTILFSLIVTGIMVITTIAYQKVVDEFILKSSTKHTPGIVDELENVFSNMHYLFIALIVLYIISMILYVIRGYLLAYMSNKIHSELLNGFVKKSVSLPISYYETRKRGDVLNRFNLLSGITEVLSDSILVIVLESLLAIASLIILFKINMLMSGIVFVVGLLYLVNILLYKKPIQCNARELAENEAVILSFYNETIENIETIKSFTNEDKRNEKFIGLSNEYLKHKLKSGKLFASKTGLENTIEKIGFVLIFWIGGVFVINNTISLGTLIVYQSLIAYFINPIKNLAEMQQVLQNASISFRRINDILDATSEEIEKVAIANKNICFDKIQFVNVKFSYSFEKVVLNDINLTIRKGERVAIVGSSGSGKSTLAQLLLRFYQVSSGTISIGKHDIMNISPEYIRKKIGYVSQEISVFAETLRNNLVMDDNSINDEEVYKVIKICQLEKTMSKLPMGLETVLEEGGENLSVGERQRIVIARALLKAPEVIILDESTSNLDVETEKCIWDSMLPAYKKTTFIIISHKLEVISHCDIIVVLEDGNIRKIISEKE